MEMTRAWEVEDAAALAYAREDVEGLVPKVALLKGEPVEACRALEVAKELGGVVQLVRHVG
jgi:hypothetical protein